MTTGLSSRAGENIRVHQRCAGQIGRQIVLQSVCEMEARLFGNVLDAFVQRLVAVPADLDAAEKVGLRSRHLENAIGFECGLWSENFRIGLEAYSCATPIGCAAGLFQFAFRFSALESHSIELLLAR